jgi:signal transduction histidine kinase
MTAAALILSPVEAAAISFIGSVDLSELRKRDVIKTIFNHSQISCSWFVASLVAHTITRSPTGSPILVPLALLAVLVNTLVNYALVVYPLSLQLGSPLRRALSHLHVGSWSDFGLAFLAGASIGAILAVLYEKTGPWIVPVFLAPALLTRQALLRSQMLIELDHAYKDRETALQRVAEEVDRERTDERRLIAADLHDEVLQPLFRVSLFAQVLRSDLANGKLLELEEDLPQLVTATDEASSTVRDLVGDLRKSGLGRGGLKSALARLVAVTQGQTRIVLHHTLDDADPAPRGQLALYQIAKEALGNALRHSRAKNVWLELINQGRLLSLTVRDDGVGFEPGVHPDDHYGLLIMRERATSVGGSLYIDTSPGEGCTIRAVVPVEPA